MTKFIDEVETCQGDERAAGDACDGIPLVCALLRSGQLTLSNTHDASADDSQRDAAIHPRGNSRPPENLLVAAFHFF